ncbi:MAG TPA: transketolase family protein [Acidobacteriota bacterium]|nr:transketolase family protein [Acidobacteriota bacterium]
MSGEVKLLGTRNVYGQTLVELGEEREDIVVLDADLAHSTQTALFGEKFPDRFFNMGIAEMNMMGTAAGLAASGKIAFASTFAIFATGRAWEVVRQSICLSNLDVKIVASHGGITTGEDGASHQMIEDFTLMRVLPNMKVCCPADGIETRSMIRTIIDVPGPVYVRVSRAKFPVLFPDDYQFRFGKVHVCREGGDITLVGIGYTVYQCLQAAEELAREGIQARVLNLSTIKPIDVDGIVKACVETGALLTIEEHTIKGGMGGAVAEVVCQHSPVPMKIMGVPDTFGRSGGPEELMVYFHLTPEYIVREAKILLKKK